MTEHAIGSLVSFRGRDWVVLPSDHKDLILLRPLTGRQEDVCGVFRPLEGDKLQKAELSMPGEKDIGDFESARLLRDAARLLLRNGAAPLRSIGHLNFRPRPYQLVPLIMALKIDPVRMLIADDVGVGKTIEALLIARELHDRGEISRMAVVCPPYLCDQWQRELADKFNIHAKIIRTNTLARLERQLPRPNVSVFEYFPHIVVSIDFVKSDRRRDAFLLHAPKLVIVDEAHGVARPGGKSTSQQQRNRLVTELAADTKRHLILVTATPHSGVEDSFVSLLGMINPEFGKLDMEHIPKTRREELAKHFVQRQRADVEKWNDEETRFPRRDAIEETFKLSSEYRKLFNDIYKFARELVLTPEEDKKHHQRVRYWAALALLRCVMSSPAAARTTLMKRAFGTADVESVEEHDYSADVYDPTDVESTSDVEPVEVVNEAEDTLEDTEKRRLREFAKRAEGLKGGADKKVEKAAELVEDLVKNGFRPIVFCRFIATADYVAEELEKRLKKSVKKLHVLAVTGRFSEEEREIRIQELGKSEQRVLVATDCLSEGINLQDRFDAVLHYDLPWNPNRLEQREGRVDRYGQCAKVVKAIILYGQDNPVDGAVLNVLLRKASKIHKSLGIRVPIPVDSETVMETVLQALFFKGKDPTQIAMDLFEDEAPIVEVHKQWERAADREKKSRTLFAQHAIKPGEVAEELKKTDEILGGPEVVERFMQVACQRLKNPLKAVNAHYELDIAKFPMGIKGKLGDGGVGDIVFKQPQKGGDVQVTRNHPVVSSIAEYVLDAALNPDGSRLVASRSGVIRTRAVDAVTALLLVRIRFLIAEASEKDLGVVEECGIIGLRAEGGKMTVLPHEETSSLFESAAPSSNLAEGDKGYWLNEFLKNNGSVDQNVSELANARSAEILDSFKRLRKALKADKVEIEPLLPGDVLAVSVLVPEIR